MSPRSEKDSGLEDAMGHTGHTEEGIELVVESFRNVELVDRQAFMQICQSQRYVHEDVKTPPKIQPFRYMDLPTEIRLQIAQYALNAEQPLSWRWIDRRRSRTGTFEDIDKCTGLCRVSRQMYAETSTLVWEVNTFEFDRAWLGVRSIHPANTPRSSTGIMQAYSFFIRHAGHNVIHAIRSVLFRFDLFGTVAQIMRFVQSSADHLPRAHLTAVIENWYILRLHGVSTTSAMHCFVGVAREMLKYLTKAGLTDSKRNWRIRSPQSRSDCPQIVAKERESAMMAQALEWIDHGI